MSQLLKFILDHYYDKDEYPNQIVEDRIIINTNYLQQPNVLFDLLRYFEYVIYYDYNYIFFNIDLNDEACIKENYEIAEKNE